MNMYFSMLKNVCNWLSLLKENLLYKLSLKTKNALKLFPMVDNFQNFDFPPWLENFFTPHKNSLQNFFLPCSSFFCLFMLLFSQNIYCCEKENILTWTIESKQLWLILKAVGSHTALRFSHLRWVILQPKFLNQVFFYDQDKTLPIPVSVGVFPGTDKCY